MYCSILTLANKYAHKKIGNLWDICDTLKAKKTPKSKSSTDSTIIHHNENHITNGKGARFGGKHIDRI